MEVEDLSHIYLSSVLRQPRVGLLSVLADNFSAVFFSVFASLNASDGVAWCMSLWSLWKSRNERVWENKNAKAATIIWVGNKLFIEWTDARELGNQATSSARGATPDAWVTLQKGWGEV